jgi:hypothetical protein
MLARLQSIWSCSRKRVSMAWCNCSQTPAAFQSRRRRQQVMPLPFPRDWGRSSHVQHEQAAVEGGFVADHELARTAFGRRHEGWDQGL